MKKRNVISEKPEDEYELYFRKGDPDEEDFDEDEEENFDEDDEEFDDDEEDDLDEEGEDSEKARAGEKKSASDKPDYFSTMDMGAGGKGKDKPKCCKP